MLTRARDHALRSNGSVGSCAEVGGHLVGRFCRPLPSPTARRADGYRGAGDFFLNDPHLVANGWVYSVSHPVMGEYNRWGPLVTFAKTPGRYGPGVLAGQQTDKILNELGYDAAATADLHSRGVVWTDNPAE